MEANVPLAIQIVIDDVGWWCGEDGHERGEPYRSGAPRPHVPADYAAIVELGRRLGVRPQAAMILCEWDRHDILRQVPSATWQGAAWDNSRWVGPWLDEAAEIINNGREHFELTIHGLGHEYWDEAGVVSRAEWHDPEGRMRPRDQVRAHPDYYERLLDQNGLGPMPQSFVPAAFQHRFAGEFADILAERGVRYLSTPFGGMFRDREPEDEWFGVEAGVLTVNRTTDLVNWHVIGPEPQGEIVGPICGMHWPNLLHEDPDRSVEVVQRWVDLLQPYDARSDRMLARNAAEGFSQCVYHKWARVRTAGKVVEVDLTVLQSLQAPGLLDSFHLKLPPGLQVAGTEGFMVLEEGLDAAGHGLLKLQRQPGSWRGVLTCVTAAEAP